MSWLVYNLLKGLITYLYRGYNPVTKYDGHPSMRWIISRNPGFQDSKWKLWLRSFELKHVPSDHHKTRKGTQPTRCGYCWDQAQQLTTSVFQQDFLFDLPPTNNRTPVFWADVSAFWKFRNNPPHTIFSKAPKLVLTWYVWTVSPSTPSARQ